MSDFMDVQFRLKNDYAIKALRLENCLLYPETRAIVHKTLTGEVLASSKDKLYGHLITPGMTMTPAEYYLAARREDYEKAHAAYDNFLSKSLDLN